MIRYTRPPVKRDKFSRCDRRESGLIWRCESEDRPLVSPSQDRPRVRVDVRLTGLCTPEKKELFDYINLLNSIKSHEERIMIVFLS